MTAAQLKIWLRFYGNLSAVAALNGLAHVAYVVTGAGIASATGLVSTKDFTTKGILCVLLGTVFAAVVGEIYRHPLPEPTEPTP